MTLPPRRTGGLAARAEQFCERYCQHAGGECLFRWQPDECPLWQFVHADMLTMPPTGPPSVRDAAGAPFDPEEGYEWPSP